MPGYTWMKSYAGDSVPPNAVRGGRDLDGSTIYVGRAFHRGDMLPAKVIPEKNVAYVCWGGEEHAKHEYEILCPAQFTWVFYNSGGIPDNAVICGRTEGGEPLYAGRVFHNGAQTVGKIQPSHGVLYIPFDGEELSFKEYEVLVMN